MKPQIVMPAGGVHNEDMDKSMARLKSSGSYKDASTVCIVPSRGTMSTKVVQSWMGLIPMMNQKFMRLFAIGMEVGQAYSSTIEMVLAHPELSQWKYIWTLEDDNIPPPDALPKLVEAIEGGVNGDKYDALGSLYWTKGEGGQPMMYGDPKVMPKNFIPQIPPANSIAPCNGLGMGCTLFRMSMFKDNRIPKPWFKTLNEFVPGTGSRIFTQDLYFFDNAGKFGYKFACDSRVLTGHYDINTDITW